MAYARGVRRHRGTLGFTLVELLVIAAVGLLFIGVILAVVPQRIEAKRRSTCLNNLKQIGLAMRLYSGDCTEKFPCDKAVTTVGSFALLTNTYQTNYKTWICPRDKGVTSGSSDRTFTSKNVSYAYGGFGLSETVQPDTPVACDRTTGNLTSARPYDGNRWTHKTAGGNVLFADGHVAWKQTMDVPLYHGKNP